MLLIYALRDVRRGGHDYRRHANPTPEDGQRTTRTLSASSTPTLHYRDDLNAARSSAANSSGYSHMAK
jgi:hypothetical protein